MRKKTDNYLQTIEDLNIKDLEPGALFEIIKLQARRISELELDFQALGGNVHDLEEKLDLFERTK
jgi:hypothetical protein